MDNLNEEEEQSCVINTENPASNPFASMNRLNGLIGWGRQKRLRCYMAHTEGNNNANSSSSSFVQADASPKSSVEEEEVSSKESVTKIAIKQGDKVSEEEEDSEDEEVDMNQNRKMYTSNSLMSTCTSTRKKRRTG